MRRNDDAPMVDAGIVAACAGLLATGLAAIYSVSLAEGAGWAQKQLVWTAAAALAAALAASCSLSRLRRWAPRLLALTMIAMAATFLFDDKKGAHRWIVVGGWSLQPSEFFKWTAIVAAAYFASRPQYKRRQAAFVMPVVGWLTPPLILAALQRDFGTPLIVSLAALMILFLSGLELKWIAILFAIVAAALAGLILDEPHRQMRLMSFMHPFESEGGYNQKHALIAFTLGGLFGGGLGRSIEKWGYLPEAHNDFIIAIIAEESGLAGVMLTVGLLFFITARAIAVGRAAESRGEIFGALYAFGFAALLTFQVFINIGGNLALLPFKGFTLPMVSYGGSSLAATGLMVGVLLRVDLENRRERLVARTERG